METAVDLHAIVFFSKRETYFAKIKSLHPDLVLLDKVRMVASC